MDVVSNMKQQIKTNHNELSVLAEQTSQIFLALNKSIVATVINSIILTVVLWGVIEHKVLLTWLILLLFVSLLRYILANNYKSSSPSLDKAPFWMQRFLFGSVTVSVIWGASSIWLFPSDDLARQTFLAFVIGGMVAGAVTTLSYNKIAVYIFISFSLLPLMIRFFYSGTDLSIAMGTMIAIYFFVLLQSAKQAYIRINENICMRIENIEQQRSLNESENRYETLLNTATDAFFLHDLDGKIMNVNNQACRSLGYTKDELINMYVSDVDLDIKAGKLKEPWNKLEKGESIRIESTHCRKDGSSFPVEVGVGHIHMGDEMFVSVFARDITERKRVEKMKNEFISTVSHELRTPLTSIKGSLGLMTGGAVGPLTPEAQEMLTVAENNSERLLLLINDILDMQKIESDEFDMEFEKMDVMPFLKQSMKDNKSYVEQYGVKILLETFDESLYVKANKNRLMQVMANLLSNAAKFSHTNGMIKVAVARKSNNIIRISVTDNGYGIAKEFHSTIFDKFTQGDSSDTRSKGGTGLGLNISKAIIDKHDGKIGFISEDNVGTTFYFDLPEFSAENNVQ